MSRSCRNQQQKETEKKTFRPHGSLFGKNHFSCKWQSNQQWLETKKKLLSLGANLANFGDQIRKEWKRKKKLLSLTSVKSAMIGNGKKNFCQVKSAMNGNEKKTFLRHGSQISNHGTKKKTFLRHGNQISKEWKRKKLKMKPGVHRCQTKCGYACSKCPVLVASRGEFSRMLIVA